MKICIDAGHNYSGYDTGVVGVSGIKEQDVTFDIANKLKNLLLRAGNNVVMTRNSKEENLGADVNSSLKKRADICNKNNCDLFISIHCNSGSTKANGTEVLIPGRGGKAEEYATKVADSICRGLDTTNRGVRVDTEYLGYKLYVLHNTECPAILIEVGFLTNSEDADKLLNRTDDFAEAIAKSIIDGYDISAESNAQSLLTSANDITWELNHAYFPITDMANFVKVLDEAKKANSPLYWGYYKLVNRIK